MPAASAPASSPEPDTFEATPHLLTEYPALGQRLTERGYLTHQDLINAFMTGASFDDAAVRADVFGLDLNRLAATRTAYFVTTGSPAFVAINPQFNPLAAQLQSLLERIGHDVGGVDGIYGPKTAAAVLAAAQRVGVQTDGSFVTQDLLEEFEQLDVQASGTEPSTLPLSQLFAEYPALRTKEVITNQDLINALMVGTDFQGASVKARRFGLDLETLVTQRLAVIDLGEHGPVTPLEGLLHQRAPERWLATGKRNDEVKYLQEDLTALGFDVGAPDGVYLGKTSAGVAAFARRHGFASDGSSVPRELLTELIRQKTALIRTTAQVKGGLEQLTAELHLKDPGLLDEIRDTSQQLRELPDGPEKMQALEAAMGRLDERLKADIQRGVLGPESAAHWADLKAIAERSGVDGTLLSVLRGVSAQFSSDLAALFKRSVRELSTAIASKNPALSRQLVADIEQGVSLTDPEARLEAFTKTFEALDAYMGTNGHELDPATLANWERFKNELARAEGNTELLALVKEAQRTFLEQTLSLVEQQAAQLGPNPDTVTLSAELERAMRALEAEAGATLAHPVTADMLREIAAPLSRARAEALLPHINQAMAEAAITTPKQQAAFIAQLAHESARFSTFRELGSTAYFLRMYDPAPVQGENAEARRRRISRARSLGNTEPGDGPRFRGRGAIQLTGRTNYARASRALFPNDPTKLLREPELVEDPSLAFRVSAWFWSTNGLNDLAEAGDLRRVTRRINGGYNGWEDRLALYARALTVMGVEARRPRQ